MSLNSASQYVPATLVALTGAVTLGNWYLRPEAAPSWMASMAMTVVMAIALLIAGRRSWSALVPQCAGHSVREAVVFGALIMLLPLVTKLAHGLGLLGDPEVARRFSMASFGAFLVVMGNRLPKTLQPLSSISCDVAAVQAFQRFAGWTWVLTGLGYTFVWLALPLTIAKPISLAVLLTGMLMIVARIAKWRFA
jgi:hypothetical protein